MQTKYIAGRYEIKYRGRGIIYATLTASQAKALFEIMKKNMLEFESITLTKQ
jgi:hypothetical protein